MRLLGVGYVSVGFIVGLCISATIILLAPSDRTSDISFMIPGSELWASIVGALVGGFISALVAQSSFQRASEKELKRDEAQRKSVRRANAYALLLKLIQALDRVHKAHNYYRTYEASSVVEIKDINLTTGELRPRFQVWKPLEGKRKEIGFEVSEKSFILEERALELFNLISDLEGALSNCEYIENYYYQLFLKYIDEKAEKGETRVFGKRVETANAPDEYGLLKLSDALEKLRAALAGARPGLLSAVRQVQDLIEKEFGRKINFEFDESVHGVADYARSQP